MLAPEEADVRDKRMWALILAWVVVPVATAVTLALIVRAADAAEGGVAVTELPPPIVVTELVRRLGGDR